MKKLAQRLDSLFDGNKDAYGRYFLPDAPNEQGKMKGSGMTVHKENYKQLNQESNKVTIDLWLEHFNGDGIGIVPIKPDCTVRFGAIDVDDYDVDRKILIQKIIKLNLPLVVCKTKSNGAHLFCFTSEPVTAELMHRRLKEWAAMLGHAKNKDGRATEIFPKQTIVYAEKNDIGHWINIPYAKNGGRYAVKSDDSERSLEDFLDFAESKRINKDELQKFVLGVSEEFNDGPPCLQTLNTYGVPDGSRNNYMYDVGVFFKLKYPDNWESKLEQVNYKDLTPPLSMADFQAVVKSLQKKNYKYKCKDMPICDYCNSSVCRGRKYGVGGDLQMPELISITKIETNPPTWFLEMCANMRHFKVELSTEDLTNPIRFQRKLVEVAHIMMSLPKKQDWDVLVSQVLANINIIEVPKDASAYGQLIDYLERFCTSKAQAKNKDELLTGRPWTEDGWTYFRMSDFVEFLSRHKFNEFKQHKITSILKDESELETSHQAFKIKGQCVNTWKIKAFANRVESDDLPEELTDEGVPF